MAEEWGKLQNKVKEIVEKTGQVCVVIYNAHPGFWRIFPIDNLDETAIEGSVIFIREPNEFTTVRYESEVIRNPTWKDVCILANEMVLRTCDIHHRYLEDVEIIDRTNEIQIAKFIMGS